MKVTLLMAVCTLVVMLQLMQAPMAQFAEMEAYGVSHTLHTILYRNCRIIYLQDVSCNMYAFGYKTLCPSRAAHGPPAIQELYTKIHVSAMLLKRLLVQLDSCQ